MTRRQVWGTLPALLLAACETQSGGAYARRITAPEELIGGSHAIGQVGDYLLGNEKFRVVIQDQGWSRGFAVFGGGIVDADLVRPGSVGNAGRGNGRDTFGELFPALFLQAFDVANQVSQDPVTRKTTEVPGIEVLSDGSDGGAAVIRTRASGGDFLTLVSELLGAAVPKRGLRFETDYVVEPGARHVKIVGRLLNVGGTPVELPDPGLATLLQQFGISGLQIPLGDVTLFADGNDVFAPGAVFRSGSTPKNVGFDLRFSVEATYSLPRALPALPGLVVDFLATAGEGVSYGYAVADSERNYVAMNRAEYQKDPLARITTHAMLVPFLLDAFTGAYSVVPPEQLAPVGQPGDTFEYTRYFIVGSGDVDSIRSELFRLRGTQTTKLAGRVLNERTGAPESAAWVHILDADQHPYSQAQLDANGRFVAEVEPGTYYLRITAPGRYPYPTVAQLATTRVDTWTCATPAERLGECPNPTTQDSEVSLMLPAAGRVQATVRDVNGKPLPAKVTVVSTYPVEMAGNDPMTFLFDFSLNEARRATDLTWRDGAVLDERRFVEHLQVTSNGQLDFPLRPSCHESVCNRYDFYVSRGPEYDVYVRRNVTVEPDQVVTLDAVLHRVLDTRNWVSADFHVHAETSVDAIMPLETRVAAAAAEGVEIAVATDHNAVTDYAPVIAALGLQDFLASVVGVELSTLEMGHFNAFPVRYDRDASTHFPLVSACNRAKADKANGTAFDWVECKPQQLFDNLRALGSYGANQTLVQVNHPRDALMGYFNQYYLNPYLGTPERPTVANFPEAGFFVYPHDRVPEQFAPQSMSWDFDALEVANGKRLDLLHAYRLPENVAAADVERLQDVCQEGHPDNGPGKVRLRKGGYPAFPGAVDDWLNLLNNGRMFTATGNSDSHKLQAEMGVPRNYLYVAPNQDGSPRDDVPQAIEPLEIVAAVKRHQVLVSNGPLLTMNVVTAAADPTAGEIYWQVGDLVAYAQSNVGREVVVLLRLQSAPWIQVDEIVVWANGEVLERIPVPQGTQAGHAIDDDNTFRRTWTFSRDTVLVAEAIGHDSLFPLVLPKEDPPSNVGDALSGIASGLGAGATFGRGDGVTTPQYTQKVTPYALTNPIWLDINANGDFDPPGSRVRVQPAPDPALGQCPEARRPRTQPSSLWLPPEQAIKQHRADLRTVFGGP